MSGQKTPPVSAQRLADCPHRPISSAVRELARVCLTETAYRRVTAGNAALAAREWDELLLEHGHPDGGRFRAIVAWMEQFPFGGASSRHVFFESEGRHVLAAMPELGVGNESGLSFGRPDIDWPRFLPAMLDMQLFVTLPLAELRALKLLLTARGFEVRTVDGRFCTFCCPAREAADAAVAVLAGHAGMPLSYGALAARGTPLLEAERMARRAALDAVAGPDAWL